MRRAPQGFHFSGDDALAAARGGIRPRYALA